MGTAGGFFERHWLNLPLRQKGLAVIALPVVALLTFGGCFFALERQYRNAGRWLTGALQMYGSMQKIRVSLIEESSAVRAYGLTRDAQYLKTYRDSVASRDAAMRQMDLQTHSNLSEREHVTALGRLVARFQTAAESYIASVPAATGPGQSPASVAWLAGSRSIMASVDTELGALQQLERRNLVEDITSLARALRISNIGAFACILLGLSGGVFGILLFASGIVRRAKTVEEDAEALAEGRQPVVQDSASDELGLLAAALRRAGTLLAARTADAERRARELAVSEAANRKQAELLQCILDSMGDGVLLADEQGKIKLLNPAARAMFGESIDAPPERWADNAIILCSDGVTPCPVEDLPLVRAMRGENPGALQLLLRRPDTPETWIDVGAHALREGQNVRGGIAVIRDVTAGKRVEEVLRRAREEAEQANQAKSEFLSRMSHELRTPLNAIIGFAQLLDMDQLSAPQRQSVDQILKGGRHLLTLINEVLDLARIEAGKFSLSTEPIHAGEAIVGAIELVGPLARQSDVSILMQESAEWKQFILADRQRFQQVILNLLSNGIKYNRHGGSVTVSCRVEGERFRVRVRDTGEGLSPDQLDRLFRPFERLGSDRYGVEGTGIGLALSKRLMDAMGGSIGVRSRAGEGSTFWLDLPLCGSPMENFPEFPSEELKPASAPPPGKTARLLYIEDNLSNNLLMERILENRPEIQLISAMQGRLGLELAREHRPDLICLDLHLPDLNGDKVLKELRAHPATARIPVAMISADATPGQVERLLAAGANAYFTKPLDVKAILRYVDEVLGVSV